MAWNVANFVALAVVFAVLATISVVLRFWSRAVTKTGLGIQDILIIPALISVLGIAATMIVGTSVGEMAQHQINVIGPEGPVFTEGLRNYEICNYVLQILPVVSLGFSKTSVLFLYRELFRIHRRFLMTNTIMIVIIIMWAISFFFATVFQCRNPVTLWTTFEYARTNCVDTISFYYAVSITGFITDIMILISPLPVIHKLRLPLKNRIAIACLLLLGAVVCGAGIARFVTFINIGRGILANINDVTYFTTPLFAWTIIESSLAVVGANLPLLRPLLQRNTYTDSMAWSLIQSWRSRRSVTNASEHASSEYIPNKSSQPRDNGTEQTYELQNHVSAETLPRTGRLNTSEGNIHVQHELEVV